MMGLDLLEQRPSLMSSWRQRAPVSDRECIRLCLHNSINLCGVDKEQVKKLYIKYGGKEVI